LWSGGGEGDVVGGDGRDVFGDAVRSDKIASGIGMPKRRSSMASCTFSERFGWALKAILVFLYMFKVSYERSGWRLSCKIMLLS
jgi:hypothetical protein